MQLPDVFVVQIGSTQGRTDGSGGDKVYSLSYTVHNNHDGIVAMHIRQFKDEVH